MNRVFVLGVGVDAIDMDAAIRQLRAWRDDRATVRTYVCVTPAHSLMDCHDDPALRAIFQSAGMVTPDGMGVVWLLRLLGHKSVGRVYGPDLLRETCARGEGEGWSHYFLGGTEPVLDALLAKLRQTSPGLRVAGAASPPFRALSAIEEQQLVDEINRSDADFVWVALGSPNQERWMSTMRGRLDPPVLLGIGAAFDFLSGNKKQAPPWIQRAGLEWAYRLGTEPRRLWPRYRRYPRFVGLAAVEVARHRLRLGRND